MIDGAIRLVAVVASLIVVAGFVLFAVDELGGASERQQAAVENAGELREQGTRTEHSGLRGTIEDANEVLLSPFPVESSNGWVSHGSSALLALLLYGVGLGFAARWIRSRG